MNISITSFINDHYDVIYKGAQVDPEHYDDVIEFLLADEHTTEGYSAVNSLFINTFSTTDDAILTEGVPEMEQIEAEETGMTAYLSTCAPIYGWDADVLHKMVPTADKALEQARAKAEVLQKQLLDPAVPDEKKRALFEQLIVAAKEARAQEKAHLPKDVKTFYKPIEETFPARTKCMISALTRSAEISKRRFLIAGEAHLHEKSFDSSYVDGPFPKLPLTDFLAFIKPRNVVVLCPKADKVTELGKPREELKLCVHMALAHLNGDPLI